MLKTNQNASRGKAIKLFQREHNTKLKSTPAEMNVAPPQTVRLPISQTT